MLFALCRASGTVYTAIEIATGHEVIIKTINKCISISSSFALLQLIIFGSITAVSDNTQPALSKTFQDFGFFFDVNQTFTTASNPCLSNEGGNYEQKLQN